MSALDRKVKSLQRRHSRAHVFFLVFILGVVLAAMIAVRYYIMEPVRVLDNSLYPKFKKNSILWMCKLPSCTEKIADGDFVWGIMRNQDNMVRRVLGIPGDSITITNNGKVYTPHRNFKWRGEDAFIETRSIYVPRKGDTLRFDQLNDVEQDYLISLMHEQNEKIYVKSSLWQGYRKSTTCHGKTDSSSNCKYSLQNRATRPSTSSENSSAPQIHPRFLITLYQKIATTSFAKRQATARIQEKSDSLQKTAFSAEQTKSPIKFNRKSTTVF